MIKIFGVEDNLIYQEFLFVVIQELGYELVGLADNVKQAFELFFVIWLDVVLVDIEINGQQDGIVFVNCINQLWLFFIIYIMVWVDWVILDWVKNILFYGYLVKLFIQQDLQVVLELVIYCFVVDQQEWDYIILVLEWESGIVMQ